MGIGFAAAVALIFILIWESKLVKDITFVQDVPYSIYHYLPDPPKGGIGKLILLGVKVFLLTLVLGSIYLATQQSEMVAEASKAVKPTAANEKGLVLAKYVDNILGYIHHQQLFGDGPMHGRKRKPSKNQKKKKQIIPNKKTLFRSGRYRNDS